MSQIAESLNVLQREDLDERAAAVQMVYSLPYDYDWRKDFQI